MFATLALTDDLERVLRLSPLLTTFEHLGTDPGPTASTQVIRFEFGELKPPSEATLYGPKRG